MSRLTSNDRRLRNRFGAAAARVLCVDQLPPGGGGGSFGRGAVGGVPPKEMRGVIVCGRVSYRACAILGG